jgi:hypothetical protein
LNHFGIIEVLDAQRYRDLKIDGPSVDLKRDANLSTLLASPDCLDACHFDLEFAHCHTRIRAAPTGLNLTFSGEVDLRFAVENASTQ